MIFRQDYKKIYVRVFFVVGLELLILGWRFYYNNSIDTEFSLIIGFFILFPLLWFLSYYWYYFKITDTHLVRRIYGISRSIPIGDITELSYVDNPGRSLLYVTFQGKNSRENYTSIPTGTWSSYALSSLDAALRNINPNIEVKIDQRTKVRFEKEKSYHLGYPKNVFEWFILGMKFLTGGILFGLVLAIIMRVF